MTRESARNSRVFFITSFLKTNRISSPTHCMGPMAKSYKQSHDLRPRSQQAGGLQTCDLRRYDALLQVSDEAGIPRIAPIHLAQIATPLAAQCISGDLPLLVEQKNLRRHLPL